MVAEVDMASMCCCCSLIEVWESCWSVLVEVVECSTCFSFLIQSFCSESWWNLMGLREESSFFDGEGKDEGWTETNNENWKNKVRRRAFMPFFFLLPTSCVRFADSKKGTSKTSIGNDHVTWYLRGVRVSSCNTHRQLLSFFLYVSAVSALRQRVALCASAFF